MWNTRQALNHTQIPEKPGHNYTKTPLQEIMHFNAHSYMLGSVQLKVDPFMSNLPLKYGLNF